ncbi:MAG: polymer-forming cytoskeletal protein, partial [Actinomycetota bacterium]
MIRYRAAAFVALILALAPVIASVVTTDLFIVGEDDPITEDVYVVSSSGRVEGTIDGDLIISTGDLIISGTVTGDVHALTYGSVHVAEGGIVEGSVRTVTPQVQIDGEVGKDLFVTGISAGIGETGSVGRDVIAFAGTLTIDGTVGRDVRGRLVNASISGAVGHDVDVAVQRLQITSGASVDGDVLYRSTIEADVASGTVGGQTVHLPAQSNFIFGVILTLANIIGFLAFVVSGIILLWLFRATGSAAVEAVQKHPIRTLLVGLLTLIGAPIAILVLAATLVGLPLAIVLLIGMMLAFVFGPIPAVSAFGDLLTRRRAGLFGAFVVGAVLWRLGIWLIPIVGGLLYLAGLVWGTGGWVLAAWRIRKVRPADREALPEALTVKDDEDLPEDW